MVAVLLALGLSAVTIRLRQYLGIWRALSWRAHGLLCRCRSVHQRCRALIGSFGIDQIAGGRLDVLGVDAGRGHQLLAGARPWHVPDREVGDL